MKVIWNSFYIISNYSYHVFEWFYHTFCLTRSFFTDFVVELDRSKRKKLYKIARGSIHSLNDVRQISSAASTSATFAAEEIGSSVHTHVCFLCFALQIQNHSMIFFAL